MEPSEEVRARLLALMLGLAGAIGPGIAAYAGELAEIVRVRAGGNDVHLLQRSFFLRAVHPFFIPFFRQTTI